MDEGDFLNQIIHIKCKEEKNEESSACNERRRKDSKYNHNRGEGSKYDRGSKGRTYIWKPKKTEKGSHSVGSSLRTKLEEEIIW